VLDLRGVACPGPIAQARRLLDGMRPGEVLVLISNCPGVTDDVDAWTRASNVALVDRYETVPGEFEFYLSRE
jgi:TusA-related sulfurtransferase